MAHLGEFSDATGAEWTGVEPDTFDFHGVEFSLPARLSQLPLTRFAWDLRRLDRVVNDAKAVQARAERGSPQWRDASAAESGAELDQLAAIYAFLKAMLPGPQWDRFEQVAEAHGAELDELFNVAMRIYEAVADRPTRRPGDSSAGPSTDVTPSTAASPSAGAQTGAQTPAERQRAALMAGAIPVEGLAGAR